MKDSTTNQQKANIVLQELMADTFLSSIGYAFQRQSVTESPLTGQGFLFTFINTQAGRLLNIYFNPDNDNESSFVIYLINSNTSTAEPRIAVDQYLKKKMGYEQDFFTLSHYLGPLDQQLKQFIDFLNKALKEYLYDVLIGKTWQDTPFDWGPYK